MTSDVENKDLALLENVKETLFRLNAELSLSSGKYPEDQERIDRVKRIASAMALRVDEHLRGW